MTDMTGFKRVFESAQDLAHQQDYSKIFPEFRKHPKLFHFIMASNHLLKTDTYSLQQAEGINGEFYTKFFSRGPSKAGSIASHMDGVESRHVLMMTYLADQIGSDWGDVVEIGGGYGNWLRIADGTIDYSTWTIFDMDYVTELQKWFLSTESVNLDRVRFIHNSQVQEYRQSPNVVIGAHSMSEFALEDFKSYLPLLKNANWFFYVWHSWGHHFELLAKKVQILKGIFELHSSFDYEGGSSHMFLFRKVEQ